METGVTLVIGMATLAVLALAAFAVYRWRQQARARRVDRWVREYLLARFGEVPADLHVNCSDDVLWPVLVSFTGRQDGARHRLQFNCWGPDSVAAITDRQEPASSADHQLPRQTFWPHRGTSEWVQVDFDELRDVRGLDVYWFDDGPPAGGGQCRVLKAWSVEYKSATDGDWVPAPNVRGLTCEKDRYNAARFDTVHAAALRVRIELQPEFSGGVLEMRPIR